MQSAAVNLSTFNHKELPYYMMTAGETLSTEATRTANADKREINMDSYCCTFRKKVKFSQTWDIKNIDLSQNLNELNGLTSQDFAPSKDSNETFYIQLETQPNFNIGSYSLIVCLKKRSTKMSKFTYSLNASMENSGVRNQKRNENLTISNFQMTPDDTLRIRSEISYLPNDLVCISQNKFDLQNSKIIDDFGSLLNSEEFADVTIVTGDGEKIPAHKNILSARSKVFAAMFKHPLEESQQNCVKISDFKYEAVLEMLRFIYTGCAPKLKDMTEELLSAADKYDLELLKAMGLNYLHDNLCVETAALTLKLAYLYQEEGLKKYSLTYVKHNSEDVFETPMWKDLDNTEKITILQSICALKLDDE